MATIREYFDTDFSNTIRIGVQVTHEGEAHPGIVLYDPIGHAAFPAWYVAGNGRTPDYFGRFLTAVQPGAAMNFNGKITLPGVKNFHGLLKFQNKPGDLGVWCKLFGDYTERAVREINSTGRTFLYSETQLAADDVTKLQGESEALGHKLQFRSKDFVAARTRFEVPLAFISHDSRDKDDVARPIAIQLQRYMCPVWYDEFSLKVGDRLRETIEKGLKECKKCILVLSPNFLNNAGWTKIEFDSIFTREILEQKSLVLPVWHGVTKKEVYDYSPSLANVAALNWAALGPEEVSRRLHRAIVD